MRVGRVFYLIGKISLILAAAMLLPVLTSLYYGEDLSPFLRAIPICLLAGGLLLFAFRRQSSQIMRQRECYLFVTAVWVYAGAMAGLPYLFAGVVPDFASSFFETVSGFTTTGATVLTNVDVLPRGILLWRSFTHWLGGAGIVLLFVALIQRNSSSEGVNIYKAEYSGGALSQRLAVRIEENAQIIFVVYLVLTLVCTLLLLLGGMSLFDAVNHTMSTVSTGGFSTRNASLAAFSPYCQWVVGIFMVLSGMNFSLYFLLFVRRKFRQVFGDEETGAYLGTLLVATLLVVISLEQGGFYEHLEERLRHAFFQVASIMSTAGFVSADFDQWPALARGILVMLLICGGCSGSTASGIKFSRIVILAKSSSRELRSLFRPQQVQRIEYNGKRLEESVPRSMVYFVFLYFALILLGSLVLMLDGANWMEALVNSLSCLGNVGPGLGPTGPVGNYAAVPVVSKYMLSFLMLAGRLEIYTILVLFMPSVWKK